MSKANGHNSCDHSGCALRRVGIQESDLPPGRLYLLQCPRCGSSITTYSLRRHRPTPVPATAAPLRFSPAARFLAAKPL